MNSFIRFSKDFLRCTLQVRGVIIGLLLIILSGAALLSIFERIPLGDSIYLSFITALTVGYGDIAPTTVAGRVFSIFIGTTAMIFFGVIIGISTRIIIRQMHPDEFEGKRK